MRGETIILPLKFHHQGFGIAESGIKSLGESLGDLQQHPISFTLFSLLLPKRTETDCSAAATDTAENFIPATLTAMSTSCSSALICSSSFTSWQERPGHRARLAQQFQTLLDGSLFRSELATGADSSLSGVGLFPTFYAWMPDCGSHAGAYDDASFYDTTVSYQTFTYSMRQWLEGFVSVGRVNLRGWRVDGWTDSVGNIMTTTCP